MIEEDPSFVMGRAVALGADIVNSLHSRYPTETFEQKQEDFVKQFGTRTLQTTPMLGAHKKTCFEEIKTGFKYSNA